VCVCVYIYIYHIYTYMYYTKVLVNPHKRKHFGKHEQSLVEILGRLNKKKHGQTSEVLDLLALLVLDLLALVLFFK
jgi:hypothetical protein